MSNYEEPEIDDFYRELDAIRGQVSLMSTPVGFLERVIKLLPERRQGYLRLWHTLDGNSIRRQSHPESDEMKPPR